MGSGSGIVLLVAVSRCVAGLHAHWACIIVGLYLCMTLHLAMSSGCMHACMARHGLGCPHPLHLNPHPPLYCTTHTRSGIYELDCNPCNGRLGAYTVSRHVQFRQAKCMPHAFITHSLHPHTHTRTRMLPPTCMHVIHIYGQSLRAKTIRWVQGLGPKLYMDLSRISRRSVQTHV